MTTQLTTNFTLEEFIATQHRGIDNTPDDAIIAELKHTSLQMELIRHILGDKSIHINSGYRCKELNVAVGGSATSAHCFGYAVDFICPAYGTPQEVAKRIRDSGLKFDQLIFEGTWVHISFDPRMRCQVLTAIFSPGKPTQYVTGIA